MGEDGYWKGHRPTQSHRAESDQASVRSRSPTDEGQRGTHPKEPPGVGEELNSGRDWIADPDGVPDPTQASNVAELPRAGAGTSYHSGAPAWVPEKKLTRAPIGPGQPAHVPGCHRADSTGSAV